MGLGCWYGGLDGLGDGIEKRLIDNSRLLLLFFSPSLTCFWALHLAGTYIDLC